MPEYTSEPFGDVVHVPALGRSVQVVMGLLVGVLFVAAGVGFDLVSSMDPKLRNLGIWYVHGFACGMSALGAAAIGYSLLEMLRRFEFHADGYTLVRTTRWGPLRWRRSWRRSDVLGTSLRVAYGDPAGENFSRLRLVLADGCAVPILPHRPSRVLRAVDEKLNRLLFPATAYAADRPRLDGGMTVVDSPAQLRITAGPIRPSLAGGQFYTAASVIAYINPLFTLLVIAIMWPNRPLPWEFSFWFALLGQMVVFTGAALAIRHWLRKVAGKTYEITVDASQVTVVTTVGAQVKTQSCKRDEVSDVVSTGLVQDRDGRGNHWLIRIELLSNSGGRLELLFGRPHEESDWVVRQVRRRLGLGLTYDVRQRPSPPTPLPAGERS